MSRSKLVFLLIVISVIIICFFLLLFVFQNCICELFEKVILSIMTSCIIAIPSLIIALYVSSKTLDKTIRLIYYSIFLDGTFKLKSIMNKSETEIRDITLLFSNYSNQIATLRETNNVDKKYECDNLEEYIIKLNCVCQEYIRLIKHDSNNSKSISQSLEEIESYRKCICSLISRILNISYNENEL